MVDSVLNSIKKLLGIEEDYMHFDEDILIHINSVLMGLEQMGVISKDRMHVTDETTTWSDVLGDRTDLDATKTYIYLKVRLIFDPPQNSFLNDAIKGQIAELEWRLNFQAEHDVKREEEE